MALKWNKYNILNTKGVININDNTVAVETSAELKSVLEANNSITLVYLANDIVLERGITILGTKSQIVVNKKAILYLEANYQNSAPLILFNTSSSKFSINDPKSIIIYNKSYACLSFSNTATLSINCGKVDYWLTSPQLISIGVIENNPLYSWYKSNEENIVIASTVTSSKTTITSNNLTQEEKSLPNLDLLKFQTAKILRFIEYGNLELVNAPSKIEFQRPIIIQNPQVLGRKEENITFFVIDSRAIAHNGIYMHI